MLKDRTTPVQTIQSNGSDVAGSIKMVQDSLSDVFQDFAENTTAHAPPKILTHKHVLSKMFWAVLFVTGIGVFVYFSQELVVSYLNYDTTTDIQLKFNVLEFPAVTICNQNQFRLDRTPKELNSLLGDFLNSKRADMFGGEERLKMFERGNGGPVDGGEGSPSAGSPASSGPTPSDSLPTTTASLNQPPSQGKRRKRRSVEYTLSDEEMVVIHDMDGFYNAPNIPELDNMTWFANVGEVSSEKSILLNLTQYISDIDDTELAEYGHDIEEMLQECVFLGKTCGPEDFYHFYDVKYGNCYTFNSGMDGMVSRITNPGTSFGLSLTMFINQNQYVPVLTQEAGIRVLLHRQGQVPIMEEDGFDVPPGTKSGVAVRYVEISRLGGYFSNCSSETNRTASGKHDYYPGNYTQKGCLKTCLQKGIIKNCSCANPLYRRPGNISVCGPNENDCVEGVEQYLLDNDICSNMCPTPCWESQYQYVISSSQWPSNSYMPILKESLDERGDTMKGVMGPDPRTGLSQQFLKMNVYYDNLNYYKYTERPSITLKDLIGALGGHLGLWIGMSVISFVEVFELLLCMFKWCIAKVKYNKTSSMTDLGYDAREKVQSPIPSMKNMWVKGD